MKLRVSLTTLGDMTNPPLGVNSSPINHFKEVDQTLHPPTITITESGEKQTIGNYLSDVGSFNEKGFHDNE
jgi:hypothetical protein